MDLKLYCVLNIFRNSLAENSEMFLSLESGFLNCKP